MVKIGFIGMGNMGNAILNGLLKTHRPEDMIFSAAHQDKMEAVTARTKVPHAGSNRECAKAVKYNMKFYFGLYDSGRYWDTGDLSWEIEDNKYVIDEVWKMYGEKYKSFGGWYISGEISRATKGAIDAFRAMGKQCKDVSNGLPSRLASVSTSMYVPVRK